jgi:DNA (cytosine-5)-methyltransferase 1
MPFRVVDLFSGCGGLSLGFQNAGFDVVAAFDNWEPAVKVYQQNFLHPIQTIDLGSEEAIKIIAKLKPDIIVGGPPCQDFSHAGKRNEDLGRADLTISYATIIAKVKPKFFVMENVERTLKSKRYAGAREIFEKAGYHFIEKVLDASLCGVPQKRKRLFVIGGLKEDMSCLSIDLDECQSKLPMSIADYFKAQKIPLEVSNYYRHPRNYSRRGVYSVNEPSATIRGVNRPVPANYPGHPADSVKVSKNLRPLNTLERSYVQTFPVGFDFCGYPKTTLEQLIGNAVPVKLAEFVANSLMEFILSLGTRDEVNSLRPVIRRHIHDEVTLRM